MNIKNNNFAFNNISSNKNNIYFVDPYREIKVEKFSFNAINFKNRNKKKAKMQIDRIEQFF